MTMTVVEAILFALKVYGTVIVISFLCAAVIWAVVHTLSTVAKKTQPPMSVAKPMPVPAATAAVPSEFATATDASGHEIAAIAAVMACSVPPEHVAAIAAAVAAITDGATVLHIEDQRRNAWVVEGRLAHHSSHSPIHNR